MANQVTVYKGDAAFGSFTTINEALTAINAQAGDYKIALNGTFTEAVHLSDWDGVNITFVKAEGAETAAITGEVIVGNATSPGHKGAQYAWNGNLRFEGITFDYTEATANTTRFEIRYIGTANTLDIVDCAFKGPGMINAGYNGGQPTNNNGDPNGDNGGNLLCTPWAAATDGAQGKLTVTGTTFEDGNINFWRNSADWSFTNCDFIDAPVTILGNPVGDPYDFINCDFSLTESKAGIASYLLGASDNSVGIKVVGGTMEVAEGVNAPCILSNSPNGNGPNSKAMITIDGTAVTIPENSKFIVTESYAETTNQTDGDKSFYGVVSGTNVTGVTPASLANAENAVIITTDANGAITEVIADSGNGVYKVYDGADMNVEVFSKSGVANYETFAEAMQNVDSATYAVIVRDDQAADLYSSVSTTNPAGLLIDMGNHGITIKNFSIVDSDGNSAEGSEYSTVYSTNKTYGAGVTVKADILADVNGGTTTINGTVQVNGILNQGGQIIVNGSLIVADEIGVSCADVMLTVNGTLSAGKIYHNDNTTPGKIVIGKDGVATVDDLVLEKGKGAVVEVAGDLVVTNSAETKKLTVAEGGSVTIDAADTFDVAEIAGAGDLIVNVAQGFTGVQQILAAGTTAGFTGEVKVAGLEGVNVIKTADGAYGLSDADMSTLYVSSAYASYENFAEISEGEGLFKNINAFADVNAAEAVAQAYATKMVIVDGTNLTYDGTTFLNANPDEGGVNNAYDNVVSSDKTYDLEVNGTFKAYQVVLNNAATTVSATGRLLATGETLRVMGGTITVQGTREEAEVPEEVVIKKNPHTWGGGLEIGKDTQISAGYFKLSQKAVATFEDTVFLVTAKVFEVNDAKATFDNTYLYLVSVGDEQDIQMSITNGAEVTFTNKTTVLNDAAFGMHVTVGEGSKLNLNNATFALDNSQKTTTLTNNGTVTVSGESTVVIDSLTGNAVQVLDGATITDSTIGGAVHLTGGTTTWSGTNSVSGIFSAGYSNYGGDLTTSITGTFNYGNFLMWGNTGKTIVNVGSDGDRTYLTQGYQIGQFANSTMNIVNTDLDYGYMFIYSELNVKDSTLTQVSGTNTYIKNGAVVTVDNSTWTIGSQSTFGSHESGSNAAGDANITFKNGASLIGKGYLHMYEGAGYTVSLTLEDSTLSLAGEFKLAAGVDFNINSATTLPSISVGSMQNAGTINVTVTGEAAEEYMGGLVIDANATSDYGQVNIDVEGRDGFVSFVKDNDLYVADTKTIFVSNEWNCDTEGFEIKTNVYYGVNAFDLADFNAGSCSEGSRRVVFSYNGEDTVAGLVITVTGTNTSYAFDGDGKKVNFNSGSYTHEVTLTGGFGEFVFDFAKGDYQISVEAIEKNVETEIETPVVDGSIIDLEETRVDEVAGNKVVTFTVAAGTVQDMTFNYQTLDGTVRLVLTGPDGKKTTKLFSADDGSFTFEKLKEGDYTVEFSGYGYEEEAEFKGSFTFEAVDPEVLNNTSDNAALFGTGIVDNFVGTGDTMDWFMIDNLAAGNHELAFDFTAQNGGYAIVTLYAKQGENAAQQIDIFYLQDLKDPGIAEELRNFAVADGTDLYIQIQSRGEGGNFSIALDPQ